eukprot:Plantae.Rhodophyta-Hildenbrandia_rubra.ctg10091.p1 GENE.Plantae.Rhodophyta-Hildenbrandia_rubra.ctg10091~~Plantae.Rhodophyta-Hildenbrandia_rubra.ctg10091.p1  ORF type:complete len:381 (+),score=76.60 Plantae.Rhodophyta-Hildenbrandia_rubra.ctg10091:177-1319(+)
MSKDGSVVTCTACRLRVVGADLRREHYRSDSHRVNLKRKLAGLNPLTLKEIEERVEALRTSSSAENGRTEQYCEDCAKRFAGVRAYEQHCDSRRHRDRVRLNAKMQGEDVDMEEEDRLAKKMEEKEMERRIEEATAFGVEECCFCGEESQNAAENLSHMAKAHGFFVPYAECLKDVEGLLEYLGQKVGVGFACVECDRGFESVDAAQRHMKSKGHCRMVSDDDVWLEEYASFYEFNVEDNNDSHEWEEVGDEERVELALAKVDDDAVEPAASLGQAEEQESEMVLPGKAIGHRSLRRYYKQRPKLGDERESVVLNKVLNHYKMLGLQRPMNVGTEQQRIQRIKVFRQKKKQLEVGIRNYYTRRARTGKVGMGVMNSGYRP